jgi:hypothetical protein
MNHHRCQIALLLIQRVKEFMAAHGQKIREFRWAPDPSGWGVECFINGTHGHVTVVGCCNYAPLDARLPKRWLLELPLVADDPTCGSLRRFA